MSNYFHLVLHVDQVRAKTWSNAEVVTRWTRLYRGPELARRFLHDQTLSDKELHQVEQLIKVWRDRLYSVSWFMSCLNQKIALQANREDGCTGRFWEGRFKSQALLDESALLSCMTYVDLNPIRARRVDNLEDSDFTSIQDRIHQLQFKQADTCKPQLMAFAESENAQQDTATLPHNLRDYIELVDWTGRTIQVNKRGFISLTTPKLLNSLRLSEFQWQALALEIQKKSILMLHGLNKLGAMERQSKKNLAA